ncbi:MAG TPA: YtxH domain-containing protein [Puia sp.]|jgi:gas vesicle protein|nr:YtxH domain-containing protein [Puia sp.]
MSTQKILVGVLTAVAAGVAIGLLLAPAKGEETRQMISDTASNLKKKFRRIRSSAKSEIDDLKEVFENEIDGLQEDVREKILKLIKSGRTSYNNIKDEAFN